MSAWQQVTAWLGGAAAAAERPVLSREECRALAQRVFAMARGPGETRVDVESRWTGYLRWARNRASLAGDRRQVTVTVTRSYRGAVGRAETDQIDQAVLEAAVRAAERFMRLASTNPPDVELPPPELTYATPTIWSERTVGLTAPERGEVARLVIDPAERAGMLSAGYLAVEAVGIGYFDTKGRDLYCPYTAAQCSMTVRDPKGTGSGWAGLSSYDWAKLDPTALAERALQKGLASRDPVALEPGRYTVVLEPQAVGDLVCAIVGFPLLRRPAEDRRGPFALRPGFSKLGLKVTDERVTLSHDPSDPDLGVVPFTYDGEPFRPVTWVDRGVLRALGYMREYAVPFLNDHLGNPVSLAFRMSGGDTSVEEMIATTKRGLLVTRFSGISTIDDASLLATGLTRDGLWLIENGEITKPVKNLRFTESPLFMLNSIEQLGTPVPVFRPELPMIVPPLKARDFSFTSMADAV